MSATDHPRWARVRELLSEALELDPADRPAFLDRACAGDPGLRGEVESLLAAADGSGPLEAMGAAILGPLLDPLRREPPATGERIGPYRLLRELGSGGMGVVYLAERDDWGFARRVALKLVRTGLGGEEPRRRFLHERSIVARLEHPHIARLLDGGVTPDGLPYFVLEYVEGEPIDRYCDARRLPIERRLRLFRDLCSAVQYAHRNLIVHRDLKPGNVLVTAAGEVKLLDFGIAKLVAGDAEAAAPTLTRTGVRPMTPGYASPEQVRGEPVTTATDVYALGVLLYELLTGQSPYRADRLLPHELERAICEQEPLRPSTAVTRGRERTGGGTPAEAEPAAVAGARATSPALLRRRLRGDLDTIVGRALEKEPARRYDSVEQLRDDVDRHLDGRPVRARAPTLAYRGVKFVRRHRVAVAAAAVASLALLAGMAGTAWQAQSAAAERDRAQLETAKARTVTEFLFGLFEGADPTASRGEGVTARELLDRGTAQAAALGGQPALQAAMLNVLARVHHSLGLYGEAQALAGRALALRRELHGSEHAEIAESLTLLATIATYDGDPVAAEPLAREALRIQHYLLGDSHPEIAETLNTLARALQEQGDYDAAEPLFRESLAMRRRLLGPAHADLATSLNDLAALLYFKGDHAGSEPLYREALAMRRSVLGEHHPHVATTLNNLASLLNDRGEYDAAEQAYRESLELRRRTVGDAHPDLARALNNLGLFLARRRQDHAAAEPLLREALATRRSVYGDSHPDVAQSLNNLGGLFLERGDPDGAEPWFREALAMNRSLLGDEHPTIAFNLNNVGRVLHAKGDHAGAESLLREALALRLRVLGEEHPHTAVSLHNLGILLNDAGSSAEAESLLERALESRLRLLGPDHPDVAATRTALRELRRAGLEQAVREVGSGASR